MKAHTASGQGYKKPWSVLLVDDSAHARQILQRVFAALPQFKVIGEAEDGTQALKAITRLQPDLIILDIRMPGMSGLEVLQALSREKSARKVIVFSQLEEEIYREKCLQLGAYAFFDKVTGFDQFNQALRQIQHV